MKAPKTNIHTTTSNMLKEMTFGVSDLGIIFDILRNKLYQNPILAICREYSCNARDAHREVGTPDCPIEIKLPNSFSLSYEIKDYGPGISPERVEDVFIKYAGSTKRNDNTQTGYFGIGSKCAASYTDSFTVITTTDHIKRTYTAYIDETQIGKLALVSELPTDEPNGTTIIVPVERKDINEFITQTIEATKYWKVKPILTGHTPLPEYPVENAFLSGKDWEIVQSDKHHYPTPLAIIDGIPYELDTNSLGDSVLLRIGIRLHFNIGEISLSASRDTIHYNQRTQKIINTRLSEVTKQIAAQIENQVCSAPTYKDALLRFKSINTEFSISYELQNLISKDLKWNNYPIKLDIDVEDVGEWATLTYYSSPSTFYNYSKKNKSSTNISRSRMESFTFNRVTYHNDLDMSVNYEMIQVLLDMNPNKNIAILTTKNPPTSETYKRMVEKGNAPAVVYDFELIKLLECIPLSTITFPQTAKAPKKSRRSLANTPQRLNAYKLSQRSQGGIEITLTDIEDTGGTFIITDGSNHISGDLSIKNWKELSTYMNFVGQDRKTVYGFTETRAAKLSSKWVSLEKLVNDKLNTLMANITLDQIKLEIENDEYRSDLVNLDSKFIQKNLPKLSNNSPFRNYLVESARVVKFIEDNESLINILTIQDKLKYNDKNKNCPLGKLFLDLNNKYPLLMYLIDNYYVSVDKIADDLVEYVCLMDEKHAKIATAG